MLKFIKVKTQNKFLSCALLSCLILSCQPSTPYLQNELHHLDLLATGVEYREFIEKHNLTSTFENAGNQIELDQIEKAIKIGNRNLDWLIKINKKRVEDGKTELSITNPKNTRAYPIDSPFKYSPTIIDEKLKQLISKTPNEISIILTSDSPIPNDLTVSEEIYLSFAPEYNRIYESAIRWKLLAPYLQYYKKEKKNDIRGYYFLMNQQELATKLKNFSKLDRETALLFKTSLQGVCFNTTYSFETCLQELDTNIIQNNVYNFYLKYKDKSEQIYQDFFNIKNPRPDAKWSKMDASTMIVPFQNPQSEKVLLFLKNNIEDEWKTTGWNLVLNFQPSADIHIVFKDNITPNVNGLGGNTITMDKKSPLSEWDVQWTIRHEFGHVLGFPDCYLEFYDEHEKAMIGYQIDTTNLMCSRAGKFKSIHFEALKETYLK